MLLLLLLPPRREAMCLAVQKKQLEYIPCMKCTLVFPSHQRGKIKALLYYIVKAELMSSKTTATAKNKHLLVKSGIQQWSMPQAAITTDQFVLALFTSQRSMRCPGGVLRRSQRAHVCISWMLTRAGARGQRLAVYPAQYFMAKEHSLNEGSR